MPAKVPAGDVSGVSFEFLSGLCSVIIFKGVSDNLLVSLKGSLTIYCNTVRILQGFDVSSEASLFLILVQLCRAWHNEYSKP